MLLDRFLSAVIIVIVNLVTLSSCAVKDEEGKLISAQVVSWVDLNISRKPKMLILSMSLNRFFDMVTERLWSRILRTLGETHIGGP